MKKCLVIALAMMLVGALATGVLAKADKSAEKIFLYEKDAAWVIVPDGAFGVLHYHPMGSEFKFTFNGKRLDPGVAYELIYYVDLGTLPNFKPWTYTGGSLAIGTANRGGNINLVGSVELNSDLPLAGDMNPGGKIWLVLDADFDGSTHTFNAWQPAEYLFENSLITYDDTDV